MTIGGKSLLNAHFPVLIDCKFLLAITFVSIHPSCTEPMGVEFPMQAI